MTSEVHIEAGKTFKKQATTGKLIVGLLFDVIGMMSYGIPVIAEITDIVWAPIAGFAMTMMYKGTVGKVAGVIAIIEELVPGLDFIPSFTLTWLYELYQDKKNKAI
ncbi:hypothetical protein [Flavobacterium sp. H122]|uniref:hypothetical protein n=1 Tax=Flavobacterium sp. H122 TaxID=2529860 RepID=UPI0010A9A79A|nr:hypothetical protein [Flavobacterium sp. H122]